MRSLALLAFLVCLPSIVLAQVGRSYITVEAYVGLGRVVHVGQVVELKQIEYNKPLTSTQKLGKPFRLIFQVSETIRAKEVEQLELVLSLQSTHHLQYLLEQQAEIMLVGGPSYLDRTPWARVGIEEQGKRVDGQWYQFRLLNPLEVPESGTAAVTASDINRSYDSCRLFTNELEVIEGREKILKRARAFARHHTELLSPVWLRVPNEFGALCGTPNAYSMILLPKCPSTEKTLTSLKDDPSLVMSQVKSQYKDFERSEMLKSVEKALTVAESDGK